MNLSRSVISQVDIILHMRFAFRLVKSIRFAIFCLQSIVMLHDSNQYKYVVVEDFGIVSQYAPRTIRGDIQTMVYVRKIFHN